MAKKGEYKYECPYDLSWFPFSEQLKTPKEACKLSDASREIKRLADKVEDWLVDGYRNNTISGWLVDNGVPVGVADKFVASCYRRMISGCHDIFGDTLNNSVRRLNKIYRDSMASGDRQNAIKAVQELNKLAGLYTQKVELTADVFTMNFGNGEGTEAD